MSTDSQRRSGRKRQPSTKYTVDAFDGLDIDDEVDDGSTTTPLPLEDSGDDADFRVDANPSPEPPDDEQSNAGDIDGEDLDDFNVGIDQDYDDGESLIGPSDTEAGGPSLHAGRRVKSEWGRTKASRSGADPRFNPRGLLEPVARGSKEIQRLFMFGPTPEDQTPPLQGHYKWSAEPTLPSRRPNNAGFGGFKRSFFLSDDALKQEADEGWDWYNVEGGKEAFQAQQITSSLNHQTARAYMPATDGPNLSFVMGPYKDQRLFRVPVGSSVDLNQAWVPKVSSATPSAQNAKTLREGWMINLGGKVLSLDWAPNHDGTRQFVAISTLLSEDSGTQEPQYEASSAPAFTPQPALKSSIQIWEVSANADGHIDTRKPPRLRKVICTAWGDVRLLKWCPAPRRFESSPDTETINLGLLAGLWGDGALRVLDIQIPASLDAESEYALFEKVAFVTRPPDTLCTALAWLSPTGIAAGCANGTLGVWNLPSSFKEAPAATPNPTSQSTSFAEPVVYASLATTYILAIVSCYPSRPNILLATTMAGHLYMVDLMDLSSSSTFSPAATVRSTRSRIGRTILVWHDWSQMALSADDNFTLVAYPLRRFFRQIGCTRFRSPVMSLSVSPVHPFVLSGCVGGEVTCNNPLRRAYESKVPIWNQIWFTHEWRQLKPDETERLGAASKDEDTVMAGAEPGAEEQARVQADGANDQSGGISRILEGYKCEQIKLFNTEDSFVHRENGAIYTTVYELKTSITSVGWNPNVHVGGWVAAGMASGLLRIEDIAS